MDGDGSGALRGEEESDSDSITEDPGEASGCSLHNIFPKSTAKIDSLSSNEDFDSHVHDDISLSKGEPYLKNCVIDKPKKNHKDMADLEKDLSNLDLVPPLHESLCEKNPFPTQMNKKQCTEMNDEDSKNTTKNPVMCCSKDKPKNETLEYFISLGAKPKQIDYLGDLKRKRRWLYEALVDYHLAPEKLHQLLRSGVSANMEFTDVELGTQHKIFVGYSPIHFACTEGGARMLEDLISYRADVNKIGKNGESALYYACVGCKINLVRILLRHNADVNITHPDIGGETPLLATVASYSAEHSKAEEFLAIARMLILAGADVNTSDYMDVTPLYIAVTKKDTRMTKLLINSGATLLVSGNNEYATKLLMRAIDNESEANVRLLISYGCDVNGVSQSHGLRHTPLDLAVVKNNLGIILDLLNAGADENLNEPLHSAARNKHLVTLLLLIAQGGDVNARNNVDKATLLLTLTRARSVEGVDMLMRLAANPNFENTLGTTPLWAAVRANYPELVKKFIQCNCSPDALSIQHFLYRPITAVQLALELKFFDMAKWLLYSGCSMKQCWLRENNLAAGLRDDPDMLAWLERWTYTPRSLRFLCRTVVRKQTGLKLPKLLDTILYPDSLKDFIRIVDIEAEVNSDENL